MREITIQALTAITFTITAVKKENGEAKIKIAPKPDEEASGNLGIKSQRLWNLLKNSVFTEGAKVLDASCGEIEITRENWLKGKVTIKRKEEF